MRVLQDCSLVALCKRVNLIYGTVMNSRSTDRLPTLEAAVSLSTTLGNTVEWLLTGKTHNSPIMSIYLMRNQQARMSSNHVRNAKGNKETT